MTTLTKIHQQLDRLEARAAVRASRRVDAILNLLAGEPSAAQKASA